MIECKTHREAALFILEQSDNLPRVCGSFLGQIVVAKKPLTPKQAAWFDKLAKPAGIVVMLESEND